MYKIYNVLTVGIQYRYYLNIYLPTNRIFREQKNLKKEKADLLWLNFLM